MKIGVVIGRFQVDRLTDGHDQLLSTVAAMSDRMVILVGVGQPDARNPLSFEMREGLFNNYPGPLVLPIFDMTGNDLAWSVQVDQLLQRLYPRQEITLYYGRDGFASHYAGGLKTEFIATSGDWSGSQRRKEILLEVTDSEEERAAWIAGVTYALG